MSRTVARTNCGAWGAMVLDSNHEGTKTRRKDWQWIDRREESYFTSDGIIVGMTYRKLKDGTYAVGFKFDGRFIAYATAFDAREARACGAEMSFVLKLF